ncbi:MAG: hypothetical protein IJ841_12085 [Prevotella sp.]|nr:hypothetical protein [Prevotella sp.]
MKQLALLLLTLLAMACSPEPPLHLYDAHEVELEQPVIDIDLQVYWNYEMAFGIDYDWQAEWYYGWDDEDRRLFGELGYTMPGTFSLRRYYTGNTPYAPHTSVLANTVVGNHFTGRYDWGFWDILVWNQISTLDGVQSLIFDEETSLDSVVAFTNQSMRPSRYHAPKFTHAFYEPEQLFSAYDQAIDINADLEGFVYNEERNVWVKKLDMLLHPITYIYLTQIILHNNRGRIAAVDGMSNLSGLARTTNVNTGQAGEDAISVGYSVRLKNNCQKQGESVDIVGGRLMTFGICNHRANSITRADEVSDPYPHYMDVTMQFNNGMDSTFVFDVTRQVRQRYKGGVITVELDLDTVPIPRRPGGSGFNAVVKDYEDGGTHEFEM